MLGVFYGLTGSGHSYRELEDEAKLIKNEILKVKDVAKVEIYGTQTPTIDISVSPSVMARSGITMADIARAFEAQNKVVDAGGIDVGSNRLRIESTGNFYSLDDIRNLTIASTDNPLSASPFPPFPPEMWSIWQPPSRNRSNRCRAACPKASNL